MAAGVHPPGDEVIRTPPFADSVGVLLPPPRGSNSCYLGPQSPDHKASLTCESLAGCTTPLESLSGPVSNGPRPPTGSHPSGPACGIRADPSRPPSCSPSFEASLSTSVQPASPLAPTCPPHDRRCLTRATSASRATTWSTTTSPNVGKQFIAYLTGFIQLSNHDSTSLARIASCLRHATRRAGL